MIIFLCFWEGNLIWSLVSYITLVPVITNRYFNIKKTANKRNQLIILKKEENKKITSET